MDLPVQAGQRRILESEKHFKVVPFEHKDSVRPKS